MQKVLLNLQTQHSVNLSGAKAHSLMFSIVATTDFFSVKGVYTTNKG